MTAISVILPVYNGENTIERALQSIIEQTELDKEIIIVDDGSEDNTKTIVKKYNSFYDNIHLFSIPHQGIVVALNYGIAQAKGQYIARMDADDISHPNRLLYQKDYLQKFPEIGLVASQVNFITKIPSGGYARYVEWTNGLCSFRDIYINQFIESPIVHPSVMFRRELIELYGGYCDGPFPEDYELWLRWLAKGVKMEKIPQKLFTWHDSANRLSRTDSRYRDKAFYHCKSQYLHDWLLKNAFSYPQIIVCGAGRKTRRRVEFLLEKGIKIETYIDVDPKKIGRSINKIAVRDFSYLQQHSPSFIISYVASWGARKWIYEELSNMGYIAGKDFIFAA